MAELLSFWQSLRDYQLPYSQEQELHQAVAQLSDYIKGLDVGNIEPTSNISDTFNKYQELMQYGVDIMNKYIDISSLSDRALTALIIENGFEYIIDLLELEVEHLRNIVYFLPIIHALKGTIQGLTILLACFSDKLDIIEWWEDETKKMKRYTFNIKVLRIKNMKFPKDLPNRIYEFCSQYVYPLLSHLEIQVAYEDSNSNKVFTFCRVSQRIKALALSNPYITALHIDVSKHFDTHYVDSNIIKESATHDIEKWIEHLNDTYTFEYTSNIDFTVANTQDYHIIKILEADNLLLEMFLGSKSTYDNIESTATYLGVLNSSTVAERTNQVITLIQSVLNA